LLAHLVTFAWDAPSVDLHALAPEIVVAATMVILLVVDAFTGEDQRWAASSLAGIGLLVALIPIATLAYDGVSRIMFGGGYVVDNYALLLKALFLPTSWCCCPRTTSPRVTTGRASTTR
jgi:NADH-quinone oxidoreductase subunit N